MTEFWQGLRPLLDTVGAQPWMYGILAAFGVAHQFACGYFEAWTRKWSFVSAAAVAVVFGGLSAYENRLNSLETATRILVLLAAGLLAEVAANNAAKVIPGIPKYNEKVKT